MICILSAGVVSGKSLEKNYDKYAYFGDEMDYLPYFAGLEAKEQLVVEGVQLGWWYPTYEEFLGS